MYLIARMLLLFYRLYLSPFFVVQLCFSEFDFKEPPYAMGPKPLQNRLVQFLQIGFHEILQNILQNLVKLPIVKGGLPAH